MPNDPPFREVSLYVEQEGTNKFQNTEQPTRTNWRATTWAARVFDFPVYYLASHRHYCHTHFHLSLPICQLVQLGELAERNRCGCQCGACL